MWHVPAVHLIALDCMLYAISVSATARQEMEFPMPYIETRGSQIYYEVHGEGPPVLLAHGVGGNHASWFRQIPKFSRRYKVITFDHRGFGNSTDPEELGREAFVDDITALLDGLGINRAVLVGQSMGAGSVAAFTCAHPQRVRALVHCDSLAGADLPQALASAMQAHNAATDGLSQIERVLGPTTIARDPEASLLYLQLASFNSVNRRTLKGKATPWTPAALAATGVPILFVVGEEDVIYPPQMIRAAHEQTPGSRYAEIPKAGHSAYFEQADAFNRVVLEFLDGLPAS